MKALGARPRDILAQFLLESFVLTFLAGVAGVIVSIVTTYLVPPMPLYSAMYQTANHDGDIILHASFGIMLASFIILGLVGSCVGASAGASRCEHGSCSSSPSRVTMCE